MQTNAIQRVRLVAVITAASSVLCVGLVHAFAREAAVILALMVPWLAAGALDAYAECTLARPVGPNANRGRDSTRERVSTLDVLRPSHP